MARKKKVKDIIKQNQNQIRGLLFVLKSQKKKWIRYKYSLQINKK